MTQSVEIGWGVDIVWSSSTVAVHAQHPARMGPQLKTQQVKLPGLGRFPLR